MGSTQGSTAASSPHSQTSGEWGSIVKGSVIHVVGAFRSDLGDGRTLQLDPGQKGEVKRVDERGEALVDWYGLGEHWLLPKDFSQVSIEESITRAELRDTSRNGSPGFDVTVDVNKLISENGVHDITRSGPLAAVAEWRDFAPGPLELRVLKGRCARVYSDSQGGGGPPFDLRALLRQAAAVELEGPLCEAATIETGLSSTSGVYRPTGQWKNGHPVYRSPQNAELRYEVRRNGEGPNWAAGVWVKEDCWALLYGAHHRYAVACSGSIRLLPTIEGGRWFCRKATSPVKVTCHDLPTEKQQHEFLNLAKGARFQDVRRLALQNPAYVNVQPLGRWSALHQAANKGLREEVQFLLDLGASRAVVTDEGRTPLDVAADECRELLLEPPGEVQTPSSSSTGLQEESNALDALQQVAPKRSRTQLFGTLSKCGGDVDLTVETLLSRDIPSLRDEPEKWFRHFDLNGDGSLEEREAIDAIVYTFAPRVDRAEAENYISRVWSSTNIDGDQDGVIQMGEFMAKDGLKDAILAEWTGEDSDLAFEDCEEGEGESTTKAGSDVLRRESSEAELRWPHPGCRTGSPGELLLAEALDKLHEKGAIAVYFAAVIPALPDDFDLLVRERYKAYRREGLDFQVLLVPVDSTEQDSKSHDAQQWLTVPFADAASRKQLAKRFEVHSVPQIILLGKDGSVLADDGRHVLRDDPTGSKFPWGSYRTQRQPRQHGRAFFRMSSLVEKGKGMVRNMVAKQPEGESMTEKEKEERARRVLLDEAGYQEVGRLDSNWAMMQFALRIIGVKQWNVLDDSKLRMLMWEHSGIGKTQSLKQLLADMETAAWIEKPSVEGMPSDDGASSPGDAPSAAPPTHSIRHNYIAVPTESQRVGTPGPLVGIPGRRTDTTPERAPPPPVGTIPPKKLGEGEEVARGSQINETEEKKGSTDSVQDGAAGQQPEQEALPSIQKPSGESVPVEESTPPPLDAPVEHGGSIVTKPEVASPGLLPDGGDGQRPLQLESTPAASPRGPPPRPEPKVPVNSPADESAASPPPASGGKGPPRPAEGQGGEGAPASSEGKPAPAAGKPAPPPAGKGKGPPPPAGKGPPRPAAAGGPAAPSKGKGPPPPGGKGPPPPGGKGPPPPAGKAPPLPKAATRAGPASYRSAKVVPTREDIVGWLKKETNPLRWPRLLQGDIILRESLFEHAALVEVDGESLAHCFEKVKVVSSNRRSTVTSRAVAKEVKPILWEPTDKQSPADRRQTVFIKMKAWRQYFDTFLERLEKLELLQIAHGDFREDSNREDQFKGLMELIDEMDGKEEWQRLQEEGAELKWEWQDEIEGLFRRLSRVRNFRERLEAIRLGMRAEKALESLTAECEILRNGVTAVFEATELKCVFLLLLSIGNHLNAGNTRFGRADGFDTLTLLESTGYLADYKGPEPEKKTLLEYLREQLTPEAEDDCRALSAALGQISWRPPKPGEKEEPDPLAMSDLKRRSTEISKDFSSIKKMIETAIAAREKQGGVKPEDFEVFQEGNRLLDCLIARCQEAETRVGELDCELQKLHKYLAHKPSPKVAVSANRTLGILATFLQRLVPKGGRAQHHRPTMKRQSTASSDSTVDLAEGQA